MKFCISNLIFLPLVMAVMVSGGPISRRQGGQKMTMNASVGQSMGAAYFITNDPTGNFVVAADISQQGTLNLRDAVSTGGFGSHGNDGSANATNFSDPDALFSQGAVKASAAGKILAAVNAGSSTVSVFAINPTNPTDLQLLGEPIGSGGEFPVSLAINEAGNSVCVLNGGAVSGVNCFSVNQTLGLVPLANTNRALTLNQTTPATGPAGTASHIVFSEDGKQLIASVKGVPPTPGFLAVWDIASDGSLSGDFQTMTPGTGGLLPFSMTIIPGQNAILATDAGVGFDIFDLSGNSSDSVVPIEGQGATCWSSFSTKTGNFYLTDVLTSTVTEVNVSNNLTGSIVQQYPQGTGIGTIDNDIAAIGGNDFMYILAPNATAIKVLALNAPGNATDIQTVDIFGPASNAGLTISAANLQGMTTYAMTQ